jgi:Domain of unknown function (DUF4157)
MPESLRAALHELFDDRVDDVEVVENSWYARLHRGARATTRRNRILLPGPATEFFDDPALVLHEYFHVLRQWNRGRLSIARYLAEWVRHGYWSNRYERQARRFVALRLPALRKHLARNFHTMRRDPETP